MPVIERADAQEDEREQPGFAAADPARDAPDDEQADETDRRAGEPAGLEQRERQNLREQCREHVEAAAVHVKIDEGERARVAEAGSVEREQKVGVFGVGVIVPTHSVVAEGEAGDDSDGKENRDRGEIGRAVGGPMFGRIRRHLTRRAARRSERIGAMVLSLLFRRDLCTLPSDAQDDSPAQHHSERGLIFK